MIKKWMASALTVGLLSACGNEAAKPASQTQQPVESTPSITALPKATAALKLYNWSDYVDPETIKSFESSHGVTVGSDFYDSNDQLETRLIKGNTGYDLVVPSNTYISRHIKAGFHQKINKSLIPNYGNISPQLLKLLESVDPGNQYAVPYFWGMNTLAINTDKVAQALGEPLPQNEWELLFNPKYTNKLKSCGISVLDSVSNVFPMALQYLGKNPQSQTTGDLKLAADAVKAIRPDVRRFSSSGYIDDLAAGSLCLVLGYGGDLNMAKKRAAEAGQGVNIEVLVPKTGFGVWVDAFMIPKDAANVTNAYQYINHTLTPQVAAQNGNFVTYAPAAQNAKALMKPEYTENRSIFPTDEDLKNGFIFLPMEGEVLTTANTLWEEAKRQSN